MTHHTSDMFKHVCLISMPWPLFKRPSIQLGSLKSFLNQQLSDTRVDTVHAYLNVARAIGYDVYQAISKRTWLAESVYAALLYPDQMNPIKQFFSKQASQNRVLKSLDFEQLVQTVKDATQDVIGQTDWQRMGLVGFSVCLCQLTSSLYTAQQIKKISPDIMTLLGGSTVSNPFSRAYLDVFTDIDCIVNGEGELPLLNLLKYVGEQGRLDSIHTIDGVVTRASPNDTKPIFSQLPDLGDLATPDYEDYFKTLSLFPTEKRFFPTLPVETSRGCWWKGKTFHEMYKGCAFCNLNLQWSGYRERSSVEVVRDIDTLTERHQTLSIAFMDNVLPAKSSHKLFSRVHELGKDLQMFSEIRASTPLKLLSKMRSAGMTEVQVGIESLSSKLLKTMGKGTTVIQNMEIMKNCETLGLLNVSNLMLHFPSSDETDVFETLKNLEFAMPFRPLKPVSFWLGLGSPMWQRPEQFQIQSLSNHPYYHILFPEEAINKVPLSIQSYRGDRLRQKKLWKPVERKIKAWNTFYAGLHKQAFTEPILNFKDGGSFLIIRQRRLGTDPIQHRLTGISREIYLFCDKTRSLARVRSQFPDIPEDKLMPFLKMMTEKGLMFEEQGRYLSLAVKF